jgi:hypothetical protein
MRGIADRVGKPTPWFFGAPDRHPSPALQRPPQCSHASSTKKRAEGYRLGDEQLRTSSRSRLRPLSCRRGRGKGIRATHHVRRARR